MKDRKTEGETERGRERIDSFVLYNRLVGIVGKKNEKDQMANVLRYT